MSENPDAGLAEKYYSQSEMALIEGFVDSFRTNKDGWTEQQFMEQLKKLYKLARIRYTKGGHKTNQDNKIRKSFIC